MVTGGRDYKDETRVFTELDAIHIGGGVKKLICGDCLTGVDYFAIKWATLRCVPYKVYKADWDKHKKQAGPIRNSKMIKKGKPKLCLSFPGNAGTQDATEKAVKAGITVHYIA